MAVLVEGTRAPNNVLAKRYEATVMYSNGVMVENASFADLTERAARTRAYRYIRNMGIRGFKILCLAITEETEELIPCN